MRIVIAAVALTALAGCQKQTTPEGCPILLGDLGQVAYEACMAAYYEEKARMEGKPVTKCYRSAGTLTCVSD